MRIKPSAGEMVVTNGVTNHVGEVDMVVDLGNGSGHTAPYNVAAAPYNYSDMTGFNNRVVNPGLQPLKGYWTVIEDCERDNEVWERVAWTDNLPLNGCAVEVFVRSSNNRQNLPNEAFVAVTNDTRMAGVLGRYIEVRVALTRDTAGKQPVLYDLTLHGASSGFAGDLLLEDQWVYETEDGWFGVNVAGPEPISYQWRVMPPWKEEWELLATAAGPELVLTNVDLWDDWTRVSVTVSNSAGQVLEFGPATLSVFPLPIGIPATGSSGSAERYPATVNVRGEPTNGLSRVEVTLYNLTHAYPADLDILLLSPSGAKIMLMSDAGGSFAVTNATLVFHPSSQSWPAPPEQSPIVSGEVSDFSTANYGDQETQMPGALTGPYAGDLNDLSGTSPNGIWQLYIYDDKTGQTGVLQDSWNLEFFYD
jgi:subtilisin-like proprotein convertase family protein